MSQNIFVLYQIYNSSIVNENGIYKSYVVNFTDSSWFENKLLLIIYLLFDYLLYV